VTLAGRVAIVSGAGAPVGRGISLALARAGAAVGLVGPDARLGPADRLAHAGSACTAVATDLESAKEAQAAFARVVAALGPLHLAVHSWVPAIALERCPVAEFGDERWEAVWEGTMKATIVFLQAAFATFGGGGGRIVVVTPTAWATGVPGLAAYAAAVEGQRLLAKSAARQWGKDGITVNCVAPAWEAVAGAGPDGGPGGSMSLAPTPLGPADFEADVGAAVVTLAGEGMHALTGATLGLDGGAAMAP